MEYKDYYKIMGVARDATEAEVKQAYRRLARKFHPDVSKEKDAEARFKELGEAYEVLKSPEKRAAYDQLGKGPRPGEEFRPPPDWGAGFASRGGGGANYSDFFDSLFGGAAGDADRDRDHHAKVMLDLDAALNGGSRTLNLGDRVLNVQIPKGILGGQTIRLAGQGVGQGSAQKGDLYVEVDFLPHPLYRVVGRDLYLDLPVTPWEAALGASIKSPTPAGAVDLKIPPGSRGGTTLRLKGRGIPAAAPGDLYAVLDIVLPAAESDGAKAAYRAFADALPFNPRTHLGVLP